MLVVTSATLRLVERSLHGSWSGPRVLLALPESHGSPIDSPPSDDWIVIECMEPPVSHVRLLCHAMTRLAPTLQGSPSGPLAFAAGRHGGLESGIESLAGEWDVQFEQDADGELTWLGLGAAVGSNPLLVDYFNLMRDQTVSTETFVNLLQATVGWGPT